MKQYIIFQNNNINYVNNIFLWYLYYVLKKMKCFLYIYNNKYIIIKMIENLIESQPQDIEIENYLRNEYNDDFYNKTFEKFRKIDIWLDEQDKVDNKTLELKNKLLEIKNKLLELKNIIFELGDKTPDDYSKYWYDIQK